VIKVLVADDHAIVRRGLRQILADTTDIHVAGEASSGADLLAKARAERWDVIVLDINLGEANGLELLQQIRKERPEQRVIILTVYSPDQYAVRAIRSGAAGFLTKETAPENLIDAVRKVAAGGRYVSPAIAEKLASYVASDTGGAPHDALSNRELQVLQRIASGRTVSQIAEELSLSVKTISTHRTRILGKMRMKTNAELTHYAVKNGLVE
jgi:two-component system, NarL family, invasion response regulator UvrY